MTESEKRVRAIEVLNYFLGSYAWTSDEEEDLGYALELIIKEPQPRVMTLEEVVAHYSLPPVFVDDLGAQEDYYEDIQPLYFEFPHDKDDPWIVHWRGYAQVARYLDEWRHSYNQKWRCWTAKPTDEQRRAEPWK